MNKLYKELFEHAVKAAEHSYSPYSQFKVGAALLCSDGSIYTGCNIENSSFSLTNCAERTAFFKAISDGKKEFEAIAIAGGHVNMNEPCYPCGACRQVMAEFCHNDFKIVLFDKILTLSDILPYGFKLY
ncbi:MAG: cytidine deaminase [Oscillospiraceae bacterium]|nr:cytidine deaminase [Oscillospiraceae bacterium]